MNMNLRYKSLLSLTAAGSICLGIFFEKLRVKCTSNSDFDNFSPKVHAATPVTYTGDVMKIESVEPQINKNVILRNTGEIMKYGFPSLDNIRSYQDYVLSYDQRNRVPNWVFEHLTEDKVSKNKTWDRTECSFKEDLSIHEFFRSNNSDYKKSGFDRGHLAAAGNHRLSKESMQETFLLSNIAPQVGAGFNRDIWNDLEIYTRKLARSHKNIYVCTGPLYLPRRENDGKSYVKYQVIGLNHVAVPTHFFKFIVIETNDGAFEMESYVLPNEVIATGTPLHVYQVPPESIERASGFLFFNRLSREKFRRINKKLL